MKAESHHCSNQVTFGNNYTPHQNNMKANKPFGDYNPKLLSQNLIVPQLSSLPHQQMSQPKATDSL